MSTNSAPMHLSSSPAAAGSPPAGRAWRRVTDAPMRMFHWLFALCFAGAYLTAESEHWRLLHTALGYGFVGLLGFRVLYGLLGPRQVRWSVLWQKLKSGWAWARAQDWRSPTAWWAMNWRVGQNWAMALAMAGMLALVLPLTLTGHLAYNDAPEWLAELHEFFGNALLLAVLAHLGLLLVLSVLRQTNLALPMWRGSIRGVGPDLVTRPRRWLAALLLLAWLAFGAWYLLS